MSDDPVSTTPQIVSDPSLRVADDDGHDEARKTTSPGVPLHKLHDVYLI